MGFVHDTPEPADQLKQLQWMIGDWIDESPDSVVMTSCKWADNKIFLLQDIKVRMLGRDTMHLTHATSAGIRSTKQIKAWLFDSEGGYAESYWTRDGARWVAKATAVRRDGTTASMTNIFTPTGKDSYTWLSTDRDLPAARSCRRWRSRWCENRRRRPSRNKGVIDGARNERAQ